MSEFELNPYHRQIGLEPAREISDFDTQRAEFYTWVGKQTVELPDIDEIEPETEDRINQVAYSFALHSSAVRSNAVSGDSASNRILRDWIHDEQDRADLFNEISPFVTFEAVEPDVIRKVVEVAFRASDSSGVTRSLQILYRNSLLADVAGLLSGVKVNKELLEHYGNEVQPLSGREGSRQFVVDAHFLRITADRYGKIALIKHLGIPRNAEGMK